jgi:hypothetical protein
MLANHSLRSLMIAVNSVFTSATRPMFVTASSAEPTRRFLQGPTLYLRPSGSCEHVATFLTPNPTVRIARVPLHPRERFRVQTLE